MCNDSRVTCMKNYERWPCHKYDVNYMIMQGNMIMMKRVIINGTVDGNAIIGRYGGSFEGGKWWVYGTGESCAVLERLAMVEG